MKQVALVAEALKLVLCIVNLIFFFGRVNFRPAGSVRRLKPEIEPCMHVKTTQSLAEKLMREKGVKQLKLATLRV